MRMICRLAFVVAIGAVSATPLAAQSLCDLVPASVVQSTLGIATPLTAKPNPEAGNGCDYRGMARRAIWITANETDYSGIYKTVQDQLFTQLAYGSQPVPGLGDKAYYAERHGRQVAGRDFYYTKQTLIFVAKGKVISFVFLLLNEGAPKANVLALGKYVLDQPIETLKVPR
jgi:hypothetical protein